MTNAARREVVARDGLQCSYVAPDGRRCDARAFLELDHIEPHALGGSDDPENLRLRCSAHNQRWAEQRFGRDHVARCRDFRQRKTASITGDDRADQPPIPRDVSERVTGALVRLGFRSAQARAALEVVERRHRGTAPPLSLEQVLREALIATSEG